jgi:site-specific DNA-methyltransferase (adenine-specific)
VNADACVPRVHPTQKPALLFRHILPEAPSGIVFDPFMGSGTTLRAAKDLGRKAIGVEIDERYCESAARRMGQEVFAF